MLYGLHLARPGDREAGPRDRRRGQHRRDRAPAGRCRACRRVDGDGAHRSISCASSAASPSGSSSASTRTPRVRRRRFAAWSSRWGRGSTCASSRCRRVRTRPTHRTRLPVARRCRELPLLPGPNRSRADGRPSGGLRPGARDPLEGGGLARAPGRAPAARRPARPAAGDARRARAAARRLEALRPAVGRAGRRGCSRPACTRARPAGGGGPQPVAHGGARGAHARSTSTPSSTGASASTSSRDGRGRRAGRAAGRARRPRRRDALDELTGRELLLRLHERGFGASCRARTSCARPSSRRGWRRSTRRSPSWADGASGVSS